MDNRALLGAYFRQQGELLTPDVVIDPEVIGLLLKPSMPRPPVPVPLQSRQPVPVRETVSRSNVPHLPPAASVNPSLKSRLSSLRPVGELMASAPRPVQKPAMQPAATVSGLAVRSIKRDALKALYHAGCVACGFAEHRVRLVFGSGNADASIMVIGDVPAPSESEAGIPFCGEVGGLLTNMLAAIGLDRTNDVFLTNVLKCPPSFGGEAAGAEIAACMPMLEKQIDIIKPKALLLLGRVAANAVSGVSGEIADLRSITLAYRGIPAMVTEHPSALLRNAALKKAAWADLQQFSKLLSTSGIYGSLDKK